MADIIIYPFGDRITPQQVADAIQHGPELTDEDVEQFVRHELSHDMLADLYLKLRHMHELTKEAVKNMATKVITYQDKGGAWRWQIRGLNHEIVAASSEGFSSRVKAKDNLLLLQRMLSGAVVFSHQEEE